jgi:hypothetical protein
MPFKDLPEVATNSYEAQAYERGFRNGQVLTLTHLKEIADLGEIEDLRREVVAYAKVHKIVIKE